MKVASIIDENLARPHGNRQGLSYGELAVLLLTYIVDLLRKLRSLNIMT